MTDIDLNDRINFDAPDPRLSYAFEEAYERLWQACEAMPGPDYGDCVGWDGLVDAMDKAKTPEALLDILRLMRAHGASCDHAAAAQRERARQSLIAWWAHAAQPVSRLDTLQIPPQCAACMCDRRDVVSDRLVLGTPALVCCGEVA